MSTQPLSSCELKNGLSLLCQDRSKKIAADRWYVCVDLEITIPVEKKWFQTHGMDDEKFQQIVSVLGDEVVFSQKRERNFISEDVKSQVVEKICTNAIEMAKQYCSSDDFAARFILKTFANRQQHR